MLSAGSAPWDDAPLTLIPLLQLLLVEVGRLLEVGQLLLGKLALATGKDYQRLVHDFKVFDRTARSKLRLKGLGGIGEGDSAQGAVMRIVGVAVVRYVDVVEARKVEGHLLAS